MKKNHLFLLVVTIITSLLVCTPEAKSQKTCKPDLRHTGILRKGRPYEDALHLSGFVVNRSKDCHAVNVFAVFKVGRQRYTGYVGSVPPGKKRAFEHTIYNSKGLVRLVGFDYEYGF